MTNQPLADRMRPRTLEEFAGQGHIVGQGRLLRRAILADRLTSSIFWGPPGSGKTTLAAIIANATQAEFVRMNAVTSGVADVREVLDAAGSIAAHNGFGGTAPQRVAEQLAAVQALVKHGRTALANRRPSLGPAVPEGWEALSGVVWTGGPW